MIVLPLDISKDQFISSPADKPNSLTMNIGNVVLNDPSRFGRGVILSVTTPKALKVKDRLIYYVQSEKNPNKRYRVNMYTGKCECMDSVSRHEVCKHIFKIIAEEVVQPMGELCTLCKQVNYSPEFNVCDRCYYQMD
jgi:hypothetical protein